MAEFKCNYCSKIFKREKTIFTHVCEKRRRISEKNNKEVMLGFSVFNDFYRYAQGQSSSKTYTDFVDSPYYISFVKFGSYVIKTHCVAPDQYSTWLIRHGIALNKWATDEQYKNFLVEYVYSEPMTAALERSIQCSLTWGEQKDRNPGDMLRNVENMQLCSYIESAKISPWVLYNSDSGVSFLHSMTKSQTGMIFDMISPTKWTLKFDKKPSDVKYIKHMLKLAGW